MQTSNDKVLLKSISRVGKTSCGVECDALLHLYFNLMCNSMVAADFEAVLLAIIIVVYHFIVTYHDFSAAG